MKNLDPKRALWIKRRIYVLSACILLGQAGLLYGAYKVQIQEADNWKKTAFQQRERKFNRSAKRGSIYDRNRSPIAMSVDVPSVSADVIEMLSGIQNTNEQDTYLQDASKKIAQILSLDAKELYDKFAQRRRYVSVKKQVSAEEVSALRELTDLKKNAKPLRGISFEGEGKRYYPGRELLGPVLGFVSPDGFGKDGLELFEDEELRGKTSDLKGLRDRAGRLLFEDGTEQDAFLSGNEIELTIDSGIQHVAERELETAMRTFETKGASLVALNPSTGEILAIVSSPSYNPNDYSSSSPEERRNRAVTDRFEPGSVMKVFTISTALAKGTIRLNEQINCERGSFKLANVTIHDTHLNDYLTPTEILAKSSNIGTLKIALRLGEPELYAAFRRFGFGEPTGLPLPGETSGVLRPRARPWYEVETANASFGQGIGVSTVQLAVAMGAIANHGILMEPLLIRKVIDSRGQVVRESFPSIKREAVSPWAADAMRDMMMAVVREGGTGTEAAISGIEVAGKTATAQKADPRTGKYSNDKFTASFVGFVPAHNPKIVIAVVLDEPRVGHYGGDLAGPVFRRVAEASLRYLGVSKQALGNLSQLSLKNDPATLAALALHPSPSEEPGKSAQDAPPLLGPSEKASIKLPSLLGLGMKDTLLQMEKLGMVPEVNGSGRLIRMDPPPGTLVTKGSKVRLLFELGS